LSAGLLELGQRIAVVKRIQADQVFAAEHCLKIQTKQAKLVPLAQNRAQEVVERDRQAQLADRGFVRQLLLKGRQLGISTWVGGICYVGVKTHFGRKGKVLADKMERSGVLFEMYERFDREAPEAILGRAEVTVQHRRELAWEGDSNLLVGTANDPEAGRSETLWYVHCSEFAFWQYPKEVLEGLLQAIPPQTGEVYIESTANGIGNRFHAMWEAALAGDSSWHAIFLPWWIAPEYETPITDEKRADIEATTDPWERKALDEGFFWPSEMGGDDEFHPLSPGQVQFRRGKIADDFDGDESKWRQEYPSTAEEAFIATGGSFFDQDKLASLFTETRKVKPDRRGFAGRKLSKDENGWYRIVEWPKLEGHYVIGADTSTGKDVGNMGDESGGLDFSSADVIKVAEWELQPDGHYNIVPCRVQVAQFHGRIVPEVFAPGCFLLGMLYSCAADMHDPNTREAALLAPERNHSSGQTTIRVLRDMGYPKLYRARMKNTIGDLRPTVNFGFLTDAGSRQMILDTMAARTRQDTSGITLAETVREMRTFLWQNGKPEAVEGAHDDRVMSYAIALEMERWHRHDMPAQRRQPKVRATPTGR
jgi:hypothetical protein